MKLEEIKAMYKDYPIFICDNAEYIYVHRGIFCIAAFILNLDTQVYEYDTEYVGKKYEYTVKPWEEEGYDVVKINMPKKRAKRGK